jgi:septation ring formation regulator EzrA
MSESYAELLERLETTKQTLQKALDFINDDHHLTDEGIVAQEALLEELEGIERDLEAIKQEHGLG